MAGNTENGGGQHMSRWRIGAWTAAALLLLLPFIAMQFTDEVNWGVIDFAVFGALLVGVGVAFEIAVRRSGHTAYRWAVGVALAAAFLLVWLSLGVGIIGKDGDPANLMYFGVLAVGFIGALLARFEPQGMTRAMFATAFAQALVAAIAVVAGMGLPWSPPLEIVGLSAIFVALWVGSGILFRHAAEAGLDRGVA